MRVDKFMVGMQLYKGQTGINCLIDVMVYRRKDSFYLLPTESLTVGYDFNEVSHVNLNVFFKENVDAVEDLNGSGYQINRGFDNLPATLLGVGAIKDGSLFRVIEVEDELLLHGETFEDNIYYARISTKLDVQNKEFRFSSKKEEKKFWDLIDENAYVDANLTLFHSLQDLIDGGTNLTDVQRERASAFDEKLRKDEGIQRALKGLISELLTGLTAENEVLNK
ncbi:hypothetical protein COE58_24400 [Bacillus cereus]|nr:hypothetical protein COE58_24400 [Bacillus cereus]